jgi:type IV pilus assembly protein PilF
MPARYAGEDHLMRVPLVLAAIAVLATGCVTVNSPLPASSKADAQPRAAPDLREAARVNTDLGMNYARAGNFDVALDKFARAIAQDSSYAPAHAGIAFIYSQRRDPARAEEHYKRALQLESEDPNTRNNFAVFLCGQQRYKDAEKLFMQAAASPNYREPERAYTNAGVCARRIPDLDKAEAYFRQSLKLRAEFPEALQQMASLLLERKDYARARAFLQRYEKVGPATPTTLWIGAKVEFALGDEAAAAEYARRLRTEFPDSEESLSTQSSPAS